MAPSHEEIDAIFKKVGKNGGAFMDHLAPDIKLEVMGHEHQHRNIHEGHNAVANDFFGEVFEWTDWESVACQIRHVIGGGSDPWAAVELIFTGKSLKGE